MNDKEMTREQLLSTVAKLSQQVAELEKERSRHRQAEEEHQRGRDRLEELVRQRTRELAQSESRYRQLVENPLVGIWHADTNARVVFVNRRLAEIGGYGLDEVVGLSMTEFIAPHLRSWLLERLSQRKVGTLSPDIVEAEMVRKDGSGYTALVAAAALYDQDGAFSGYIGAMIDITDRKRLEQEIAQKVDALEAANLRLKEVNAELDAFAYSVSHDLRAPLRAMESFARSLYNDFAARLEPEGREFARRIVSTAEQMESLIKDLLTYSRMSRAEIQPEKVDLRLVVASALLQLETQIQEKGARVKVEKPLFEVLGNEATLLEVVTNLLSNAVKFVKPGVQPQVRIWTEERDGWVCLWVEDNGIGIRPEHHETIFRALERLHSINVYPGTGVGLAIVQKGVQRLGGRVGVESAPGQGSRFWVELPKG